MLILHGHPSLIPFNNFTILKTYCFRTLEMVPVGCWLFFGFSKCMQAPSVTFHWILGIYVGAEENLPLDSRYVCRRGGNLPLDSRHVCRCRGLLSIGFSPFMHAPRITIQWTLSIYEATKDYFPLDSSHICRRQGLLFIGFSGMYVRINDYCPMDFRHL